MTDSVILDEAAAATPRAEASLLRFTVARTSHIAEVERTWTALAAKSPIESPSQSFAFTRLWADTLDIPTSRRLFVTAHLDGQPIALLPLMRKSRFGVRVLTWFPGRHVGCNAPLVDAARLTAMTADQRRAMWRDMTAAVGADLLYLPAVPELPHLAELGTSIAGDTLYRAQFPNWAEADKTQRSKSRRKHDRQQGERLEALGQVTFKELDGGAERLPVLDTMFRQRAARFAQVGVFDPFADPQVRSFYDATLLRGSGLKIKLHVLKLNEEIVAIRYNIVSGERLFCLISSMSDDPKIQGGSPGKQCLLRVMQTVFEAGYRCFDMGAGLTDEKRHWCNVQIPLRQHYLPLTALGHAAGATHRAVQSARREIKTNPQLLSVAKRARALAHRSKSATSATDEAE